MKRIATTVILATMILTSTSALCQGPPPPPPSGGHSQNGNQTGGNAPVGDGLFILLSLGILYSNRKIQILKTEQQCTD